MSKRLLLIPILLFSACSHQQLSSAKSPDNPLAFVPSDTPYLFTNVDPLPEATLKKFLEMGAKALRHQASKLGNDENAGSVAKAFVELYQEGGLEKHGINTKGLLYSLGSTPVIRLSLADEKRFDAFWLDVLAKAAMTWEAKQVGPHRVRSVALANQKLVVVQLYHLGDLVLALAPTEQVSALVPWLVGEKRPAQSIVDSPRLAELLKKPSGDGASLFAAGTLNFLRLVEALGFDEHAHPDILSSMLRSNPRYFDDGRHQMRFVASFLGESQLTMNIDDSGTLDSQLRQTLAASLSSYLEGLAVAVPGPQNAAETLLNFGFGIDLVRLREMLNEGAATHVSTLKAAGHKTTMVIWENNKADASKAGRLERPILKKLRIPKTVDGHHGGRIALLGLDLEQGSPFAMIGSLRLAIIIATEDFDGLLAMVKGQPKLLQVLDGLEIPANGKAVSLNGRAPLPGLSIMRNERALALTFGSGVAESAESWLAAKPATAPPLMESNADGKFLAQAMGFAIKQMSAKLNTPKGGEIVASMEVAQEQLRNIGRPSFECRVDQDALLFNMSYNLFDPQSP